MGGDSGRPGEFELIARYFAPLAAPEGTFGLKDDAASLTPPPGHDLVLTKDALVAGVHFFSDDPPDAIARKALRVNLSDLAAKGAQPAGYLLGLGLPDGWTEAWVSSFADGLSRDQATYGIALLGGDTVKSPERLVVSVTVIGFVPHGAMVRRGTAQPGDVVFVTGTIGDAALGLQLRLDDGLGQRLGLADAGREHLLMRYLLPQPRTAGAAAVLAHASAAMDISDGLAGDLAKLAHASGVALVLNGRDVPLSPAARAAIAADSALLHICLAGGDDYEIAGTVAPERWPALQADLAAKGIPAAVIGSVTAGQGVHFAEGPEFFSGPGSFAHF